MALFTLAACLPGQTWSTRPPRAVSQPDAEYSDEARRAGVNAAIVLSLVVNELGAPEDIQVIRGAGFGLDEMALRAVGTWTFEPAVREGHVVKTATRVEVRFRLRDKSRTGQTARLNFSLPPDAERPHLIRGKMPANPDPSGEFRLRVRFTVNADGQPAHFQTLETNNAEWTAHALQQMSGWRFRPASEKGQPEEANGIFELMVRQPGTASILPGPGRQLVTIMPPEPQDPSLAAPKLVSPADHALFDGYPRRVTCRWEASPGATLYLLEWDYMYHDVWNTEYQGIPGTAYSTANLEDSFEFVGAQPGRWRVWPVNQGGQRGNPSEWRTFRYLH